MLITDVGVALRSRTALLEALHAEGTDCYRLFHGATEGAPGCTLDRYGDLLLWQTFRDPPEVLPKELLSQLRDIVEEETGVALTAVHWNARQRRQQSREGVSALPPPELPVGHAATEVGVRYLIDVPAPGRDPALYLDFRAARRWLQANSEGCDVLNAFAYTCGAGVAALAGGANTVTNLDHSQSFLDVGRRNAVLNGLSAEDDRFACLCSDALPALRSYAGLPVTADRRRSKWGARGGRGGRGGRGRGGRGPARGDGAAPAAAKPLKLRYRQFDTVVLDPPTWTTSKHGAVDLVRDYESLFKPCVLATRPGGTVLAVNHVASIDVDEWLWKLEKCAKKADQPLASLEVLPPEADFPSSDGKHPLKVAIARVAEMP